jgi:enoyl-CoA hydratase
MAEETKEVVSYEQDGHVVTLTIKRPEARNAVNGDVAEQMEAALDRYEADEEAWVAILTGEGTVFCAGADLKEIAAGNARRLSTKKGGFAGLVMRERTKPIIAAINGPAHAGGCEITLACDLVVAADNANFAVPEVKRALIAAAGALWRLPRAVGPAKAAEMIMTGDPITAHEALAVGLVNQVVPGEELLAAAHALAGRIAVNAPLAVQASRNAATQAFDLDKAAMAKLSSGAMQQMMATEDFKEGPRAFIEKRAAKWQGR